MVSERNPFNATLSRTADAERFLCTSRVPLNIICVFFRSEQHFNGVQLTLVKKTRLLTPTARGAPDEFPRPWVVDSIFPTGLFLVSFLLFVGHGVNKPVWGQIKTSTDSVSQPNK